MEAEEHAELAEECNVVDATDILQVVLHLMPHLSPVDAAVAEERATRNVEREAIDVKHKINYILITFKKDLNLLLHICSNGFSIRFR
jgi:uncharacterized protein YdhG (YjbR/CyaY superfamily)